MRFTKKDKMARYGYKYLGGTDNFGEGCRKLGPLEDFEEELNIDLAIFINILKAGKLYHKEFGWLEPDLYFFDTDNPSNWSLDTFDENGDIHLLYFRDYGKIWALTKEELL